MRYYFTALAACALGVSLSSGAAVRAAGDDCSAPYRGSRLSEYTLYERKAQRLPAFPEGVTPVYHIYIGRHGNRYVDGKGSYDRLLQVLTEAEGRGTLTSFGRRFLKGYRRVYPRLRGHEDELTRLGERTLRRLGRDVAGWLPSLLADSARLRVSTSTTPRVIRSEERFMEGLLGRCPGARYEVDTLRLFAVTNGWEVAPAARAKYGAYSDTIVDYRGVAGRLMTDPERIVPVFPSLTEFTRILRNMVASSYSVEGRTPRVCREALTADEMLGMQANNSTLMYYLLGRSPEVDYAGLACYRNTWRYIDSAAVADMVAGRAAHLAFTHDVVIHNLLARLRAGAWATETSDINAMHLAVSTNCMPMAANLQLCVCRAPGGRLVVYPLLNGRFISLPLREALPGAYDWEEVRRLAAESD